MGKLYAKLMLMTMALLFPFGMYGGEPAGEPAITFRSTAYAEVGESNLCSVFLGSYKNSIYTISDANGVEEVEVVEASLNSEGSWEGTWLQVSVPKSGIVKIWGDPANLEVLVADGLYVTDIDMPGCTNLSVLSLQHNALKKLDLTGWNRLYALYLSDNPFTAETPLKVGPNKPNLEILELDIIDHLDQSFNLSDYPKLRVFDGYHNLDLHKVDSRGCPLLQSLSLELTPVETLDVSENPYLEHLNIAETRISEIDLSQNMLLTRFYAGHDSGTFNTGFRLRSINLSKNPELQILNLNGNRLSSIDLSANKKLSVLWLNRNSLRNLDVSANTVLSSVFIMDNDMDFATLPEPGNYFEYFYRQNAMPVARQLAVGAELDMSARVLRSGTQTIARVMKRVIGQEDSELDSSAYTYKNGKISFNTALADSVYVEYANSLFTEYTMKTTPFMVKAPGEMGKPSRIVTMTSAGASTMSFGVGMAGATAQSPRKFFVDFGDGELKEFTTTSAHNLAAPNVKGEPHGMVGIYIPEGEVMTSFSVKGQALAAIDVTAATELSQLTVRDCNLFAIDLTRNRCLTTLDIAGNDLRELNLQGAYGDYEKNVLASLDASRNKIATFKCVATGAMRNLNLSDNSLTELNLKDYDNLRTLDVSGNKLTEISLAYMMSAQNIDLSDNELTNIATLPEKYIIPGLNLSGNRLHYGTLPLPSLIGQGYVYAPQRQIAIPPKAPMLNLSEYVVDAGGNPTVMTWRKADGSQLAEGTDYSVKNGQVTFLDATLGDVYCELTNATFPLMAGADVLKTSVTRVTGRPVNKVASFKAEEIIGKAPAVIFAATEDMQLYIDWTGTNDNLVSYDVFTKYKEYPVSSVTPGATVTIYASDAAASSKINVFSIYDIKLRDVDLTPLKGLYSLNLGNCDLTPADLQMPAVAALGELNISDNRFSEYPYAALYPNLSMLDIGGNEFTTFDASTVPSLQYLVISNNKLTSLSFDNKDLWSVMAEVNQLQDIDLTGLPALTQIVLNSNKLEKIDIEPVKNTLQTLSVVGNRLTFATLPRPKNYPGIRVFYYGNQAPMDVKCEDMTVDLSAQADVDGEKTTFAWYAGIPDVDPDTGELKGTLLQEGFDYTIENGVTKFLREQDQQAMCIMTNAVYENLLLYTNPVTVMTGGIDGIAGDDAPVDVYTLQGIFVRRAPAPSALENLPAGIYIVNGKKIIVK